MAKVVVALSGGVDSSVAAALLVDQGHEVFGVTLRLWSEPGCEQENRCCTPQTREIARQLSRQLNIPFEILDASEAFRHQVVQNFLDSYMRGDTPNPCIFCNRHIKWGYLLAYAHSVGAEAIATGHYVRLVRGDGGAYQLWRGVDQAKDQSYMLSLLTQRDLARSLFPLGSLTKSEARAIAAQKKLPSADLPESQDLCFLGKKDYRDFLRKYVPDVVQPGAVVNRQGEPLGEHEGLAFYTIGQRKGLPAARQPLYVLEKHLAENLLVAGFADELGSASLRTAPVNWISGQAPCLPFSAQVKIRFRADPQPALITPLADQGIEAVFDAPLRDITPGQMAVIYQGEQLLGGGVIL